MLQLMEELNALPVRNDRKLTFADIQREIAATLDIPEADLSEEEKATLKIYLEELAQLEADKIDAFASFIRLQTEMAKAYKAEADRLREKAKAMEKRISGLKAHYVQVMATHGLKKVAGKAYSISTRKSESVEAPETEEEIMALLAENPDCVREKISYQPDKTAIKEQLKAGVVIPGCRLVENVNLQIR